MYENDYRIHLVNGEIIEYGEDFGLGDREGITTRYRRACEQDCIKDPAQFCFNVNRLGDEAGAIVQRYQIQGVELIIIATEVPVVISKQLSEGVIDFLVSFIQKDRYTRLHTALPLNQCVPSSH